MMVLIVLFAGLFLAFSNGANDNFKGVATLLGSKTTSYQKALAWATLTTLAGSLTAFFLAQKLMVNFSGKGLVPDEIVQLSSFSISVAIAAAATVFLATRFGFPISTTHALTGALVGAGLVASSGAVNFGKLLSTFLIPLIVSPVIAISLTVLIYPFLSFTRRRWGVSRESCICIGNEVLMAAPQGVDVGSAAAMVIVEAMPQISVGTTVSCEKRYVGKVWGVHAKAVVDNLHFLSGGLVGFARGLNDTPKIAAILLVGQIIQPLYAISAVALVMALGGLIFAKRIADTMSYQITEMNDGQGFAANLVTSAVVIGASQLGVPVSTTHVSCGSLFGIGAVTRQAHWGSILKIILAWVTTLPFAATLGAVLFSILHGVL